MKDDKEFEPTKEEKPDFYKMADDFFNENPNGDGIDVAAGLVEMLWNKHVTPLQAENTKMQSELEQLKSIIEGWVIEGMEHAQKTHIESVKTISDLKAKNTTLREALDLLDERPFCITCKTRKAYIGQKCISCSHGWTK